MANDQRLDRLRQGEAPTLLDTAKGNELIDALNLLLDMEVSVTATGTSKFIYSEGKIILLLSKAQLTS